MPTFFRILIYARGNSIRSLIKTNNFKIKIFSNTLFIISSKVLYRPTLRF